MPLSFIRDDMILPIYAATMDFASAMLTPLIDAVMLPPLAFSCHAIAASHCHTHSAIMIAAFAIAARHMLSPFRDAH